MATVYRDQDADLSRLAGKRIAVLGYGSQGRAQALNLRDSGFEPVIGVRKGASWERAVADGFSVCVVAEAADVDVLVFCLPDIEIGTVFSDEVLPALRPGAALVFAHGFAVYYGLVRAPEGCDVILVAPMGAGPVVRARYEQGSGVPAILAVQQDASGSAWDVAKAYGSAIGCGRLAMIASTFQEETESDLFGEQAVLCGGLPELMRASFETLTKGGISPEIAYVACVHEVKLIVDLIYERGLDGMVRSISQTAEWGAYETGPKVIGESSRVALKDALSRIQSGDFAQKWIEEVRAGGQELRARRAEMLEDPIHEAGKRVRSLLGIASPASQQETQE